MRIYLVRHTSVDMPKGICYGQSDVELADTFPQELAEVKCRLHGTIFDKTYSSPLKRCITLARELSDEIIVDTRIKEYNFGEWERKTWNEIYALDEGRQWFHDYVNTMCPQGESFAMMLRRVRNFIEHLSQNDKNILIVTHAGIIRAFLIVLENYSVEKAFDTPVVYGQIVMIEK